jgi:hypothetical protein
VIEQLRTGLRKFLGVENEDPRASADAKKRDRPGLYLDERREQMNQMRALLQRFGAAFGTAAAALFAGLGYTQIHKVFPLPAGTSGWLVVPAAVCSAAALFGAAVLASRFFGAQRRIPCWSKLTSPGWPRYFRREPDTGFSHRERKIRDRVFTEAAAEEEAANLLAIELRAERLGRIARRTADTDRRDRLEKEAERLEAVVVGALVTTTQFVLEHRSAKAFKGLGTAIPLVITVLGTIGIFGLADWSQGQRELITLRKDCAAAVKGGAPHACDSVLDKQDRPKPPTSTTTAAGAGWLNGYRQVRLSRTWIAYRVYGGGSARRGRWATPVKPTSRSSARSSLALPPENTAQCIVRVRIPPHTRVRFGHVGPLFDHPGGGRQIELLGKLTRVEFWRDARLPPSNGPCP